ncbi:sulfotransferase [Candidatus Pelagibacter ubique]|nr:sulfotransferase [Candidatus Pelagibacter ubique]
MDKEISRVLTHASKLLKNQKFQEANEIYQNLVLQFPDSSELYHEFGIALIGQGQPKLAIEKFLQSVRLDPKNANYNSDLGEMYRRVGMLDQAIKFNLEAVKLNSKLDNTNYNLGLAYFDKEDFDKAIVFFEKAIEINPNHGFAWNNLGSSLEKLDKLQLAHEAYQKAVDLNGNHLEALNNLATTNTQFNKADEAVKIFNKAIDVHPHFFEAHFNLSALKKYTKEDPHFRLLQEVPQHKKQFNMFEATRYHFAFGKALDDVGEYDNAFNQYNLGNQLQSKLTPYNQKLNDEVVNKTIEIFNVNFINKFKSDNVANTDRTPIFIVGMPRSGTSLIEQILDSHQSIYGAGELKDLSECLESNVKKSSNEKSLDFISRAKKSFFKEVGNDYLNKVWELSPTSKYISDKMPGNFFNIGLIYLAFPNAKIIHSMRDPMDTCFSNFTKLFKDDMRFTYSQENIGNYYKDYHKVMEHWKKVLPSDFICHMKYENMINDTKKEARRLTSFIGLDWDPNCLKFYDNKRNVKTASMMQVRKPIYKTSMARWKNFTKHLKPLYNKVKSYREPDILMDNMMAKDQ